MGNTIRREPVSFKIPASPDYKFFNVTDFRGLEMTDNPFTAANNTASDLLNVNVDENNALTTRPRLEKQYDISKNINKFNKVLYCYKLMDKIIFQVLINSTVVRLYYKQGDNLVLIDNDTNNIALPETKLAIFEKKDKIYVMTGTLYCVIKPDNIMYTVKDDADTYIPTIGISTVNDDGIRVMADYEQKNILSNKYKINYFWDLDSDISDMLDSGAEKIDNGYIEQSESTYLKDTTIDVSSKLLDDGSILLYKDGDVTIIKNSEIVEEFNILSGKIMSVSNNGKWFLCCNDTKDAVFIVDKTDSIKASYVIPDNRTVSTFKHTATITNSGDKAIIITGSDYTGDSSEWSLIKLEKEGNIITPTEILKNDKSDIYAKNIFIKLIQNSSNLVVINAVYGSVGDRFCIFKNVYEQNNTHKWFSWEGISSLTGWYPPDFDEWYNIIQFNNDCSFVIACDFKNLTFGTIDYEQETISYSSKAVSALSEDENINSLRLSDDENTVYILPNKPLYYNNYSVEKALLGDVIAYSIENNKSYKLLSLKKPEILNSTHKYNIADKLLGWGVGPHNLYISRLYSHENSPTIDNPNVYITHYNTKYSTEPLLVVTYKQDAAGETDFKQYSENIILTTTMAEKNINLSNINNINSITLFLVENDKSRTIKHEDAYGHYSFYTTDETGTDMVDVKWFDDNLSIKASTGWVLEGLENRIYGKTIKVVVQYSDYVYEPEQTLDYNAMLRFQNNFWFYGNGNEIRWTGNNDPTYFPEYNYTNLGDTNDVVNDMLLVSYDTAVAFKQNNIYVINPAELKDGTYTYTFVEAKSDVGVIAPQSSIISPLTETPLYVNARGIYGLQQLKNIQSTDRISVLYSENVNKKYLNEDKKFHIQSISRLYWVLFVIPGKTSKVYVFDDRTASWYYWELPINITGCWADDLNSYFASDDGKTYMLKTNDIIDTNYSPETEYYDDGRKLIPWFWKSQILPLGTMNYSKKLINTTFILTDTDENEEYGLNYKFKAYRKNVSETNSTTISNRLNYIQSTTKKTSIPRFNFLQIELSNVEEDLNNNKLRLVGLGLKYELLEGLI